MQREPATIEAPRGLPAVWVALVAAAAAAWFLLGRQASEMGVGPGTMGMRLPAFMAMWVVMMGAMMYPAIGPMVTRSTGARAASAAAFAIGFLVPWAVYGAAAYAGLGAVEGLVERSPDAAGWLGVGLFAVAGAYQLTPWKRASIRHCRLAHGHAGGPLGGLAAGMRDGAWCIGCCWALMTLMAAVGVMNVGAIAAIAAIIFVEKILPRPGRTAALFGIGLLAFAAAAAFVPELLPGLVGHGHAMPPGLMPPMPAGM